MRVDLFDFDLPEHLIATSGIEPRDAARLLHVKPPDTFADKTVRDLPSLLRPGDALVFNDTRVIPARLVGNRVRGPNRAGVELLLTERRGSDTWAALARPAKRTAIGDALLFGVLEARIIDKPDPATVVIRFACGGAELDAALAIAGTMPLPPYIAAKRTPDASDSERYQTIYAREPGAIAAPTAGLHFTERLLADLDARGVTRHFVTLHVGAGTFLPVKVDDTVDHAMHSETGFVSAETAAGLNDVRARGGRIVAAGTTALRLLESAAREDGTIAPFAGGTRIFITPGYRFRAVDALFTNFHLPRSTLFMLVSAFSGLDTMRVAYAHAMAHGYRFYSYGDASLLERGG